LDGSVAAAEPAAWHGIALVTALELKQYAQAVYDFGQRRRPDNAPCLSIEPISADRAHRIAEDKAARASATFRWVDPHKVTPTAAASAYLASLTAREVAVLRLVAHGLTDAQVAERLVISPHTVHAHLRAIYGKLEVSSRAAATR
jgi:DNA-binding CsgD family transcriptional regulator